MISLIPCPFDVVRCIVLPAFSKAFNSVVEFVFSHTIGWLIAGFGEVLLKLISDAVGAILNTIGALWVKVPTPDLGNSGPVHAMQQGIYPIVLVLVGVSIVLAGIRLAWDRRADGLKDLAKSVLTALVVNASLLAVTFLLVQAGDKYSVWIVGRASGGSPEHQMSKLIKFGGLDAGLDAGPEVLFWVAIAVIIGITAVVLSIIQLALMFVRSAGLILVSVMVPVSAAATNTSFGQHWFRRLVGYLTMFILYKPAAATVYATALYLTSADTRDPSSKADPATNILLNTMTGVMMMLLAVLLMPALSRLVAPGSSK